MTDRSTSPAAVELSAQFEVTEWNPTAYDEPAEGPALSRTTLRKRFRGTVDGEGVVEMLAAQGPDGRGYVASERFTGTIDGRRGTLVLQHGGLDGGGAAPVTFGHIVPGSGTAELAGIAGTMTITHDENGARVTLAVTWP